jgi:hypothetical protein
MMASGKATGKWWAGKDENGNDVFSKSPTRERGLAVYDMWFRQGGTSAYSGRGSKVWAPQDLDVEHMKPMSKGGADSPSNWILARAGAQRKRQNEELGKWIDKLPKNESEYRDYLSSFRSDKTRSRVKKAAMSALDPKQFSDAEVFGWGAAKNGKAFGARTLFTSEFQPIANIDKGAGRANSGPPVPFSKGLALIAKTQGVPEASSAVSELRKIWNKDLIENRTISKQEAFTKMNEVIQKRLTADQTNLYQPEATAWANSNGFL